jgi:Fe-S-cluster-containing dehydrogenase component
MSEIYLLERLKRFNLAVMSKCSFCGEEIEQTTGKRKKEFCNNTCRSNAWYKKNKKGKVRVTDLTKPTFPTKSWQAAAAKNQSINTTKKEYTLDSVLKELETLPTSGGLADKRRKFLRDKIKELQKTKL